MFAIVQFCIEGSHDDLQGLSTTTESFLWWQIIENISGSTVAVTTIDTKSTLTVPVYKVQLQEDCHTENVNPARVTEKCNWQKNTGIFAFLFSFFK